MTKIIVSILGVASIITAVLVLRAGNYPTSGLMLLSLGIITLIVAIALKSKGQGNHSGLTDG